MDEPSQVKPDPVKCYPASYNQGVKGAEEVKVQVSLVKPVDEEEEDPIGFTLKHGINTLLTIEKEQLPIVQVYQTARTLAI